MQIEITAQAERHLKRWQQLAEWPELTSVPGKIETDRLGRIIMSPPPFSITPVMLPGLSSYCVNICLTAKR